MPESNEQSTARPARAAVHGPKKLTKLQKLRSIQKRLDSSGASYSPNNPRHIKRGQPSLPKMPWDKDAE